MSLGNLFSRHLKLKNHNSESYPVYDYDRIIHVVDMILLESDIHETMTVYDFAIMALGRELAGESCAAKKANPITLAHHSLSPDDGLFCFLRKDVNYACTKKRKAILHQGAVPESQGNYRPGLRPDARLQPDKARTVLYHARPRFHDFHPQG